MMVAMLHSNRQLRTDKDGDTEEGCKNLLYHRVLLNWTELNCEHGLSAGVPDKCAALDGRP